MAAIVVLPIKDVINVQRICHICALLETALVEKIIVADRKNLVACHTAACVLSVSINDQLANH